MNDKTKLSPEGLKMLSELERIHGTPAAGQWIDQASGITSKDVEMSERKEMPEWINKARTEFLITGGRQYRYAPHDAQDLERIIAKYAPAPSRYSNEAVERLIHALEIANKSEPCPLYREALGAIRKERG